MMGNRSQQVQTEAAYLEGFIDRAEATLLLQTPRRSRVLLWTLLAFVLYAIVWAAFAELDEITRGEGRVIPSLQLQLIQNLEGGILRQIYVREGEKVVKGQPLLQIDDTRFRSDLQEQRQELRFLLAGVARLKAELNSIEIGEASLTRENWRQQLAVSTRPIEFGSVLADDSSGVRDRAEAQYRERLRNLSNQISILEREIEQKIQERRELESKIKHLKTSYRLGLEEMKLTKPLAEQGVVPRVELLKLEREVNRQQSELNSAQLLLPKVESEVLTAIYKRRDVALQFRAESQEKLAEIQSKLAQRQEAQVGLEDRVERTQVVSPVTGTVKRIIINTEGGVIQPGMDMMEIVPSEDRLLVEARIPPKDIAFLRPGLDATVRFTAYDFTIYGGMKGKLEHISADTIEDEKGEVFYLVRIRTDSNSLEEGSKPLPIIPGMTATVDIVTGQKSVLDYLLKPILRAQQRALTER